MNKLLFVTKSIHYTENLKAGLNISVLYPKRYNMLRIMLFIFIFV